MRIKDVILEKDKLISLLSFQIEELNQYRKECLREGTSDADAFCVQAIEAINKASGVRAELQRESNEMFDTVMHLNACFYDLEE